MPIFGTTYCALPEAQHGQSVPLLLYFGIYSIADFKVLQVSTIELISRLSGRRSQELTRRGNVNAFYVDKVLAVSLDGLFAAQSGGQPDADEGLRISAGTGQKGRILVLLKSALFYRNQDGNTTSIQ